MHTRPLMQETNDQLTERAEEAESRLREVWHELRYRTTPTANQLKREVVQFAKGLVTEADPPPPPTRRIYVIELDAKVLREAAFIEANQQTYLPGYLCLYVGQTSLHPEHRFLQHLQGEHSARFVNKYGLRLRPEFYAGLPAVGTAKEAEAREEEVGEILRAEGYGVWWN